MSGNSTFHPLALLNQHRSKIVAKAASKAAEQIRQSSCATADALASSAYPTPPPSEPATPPPTASSGESSDWHGCRVRCQDHPSVFQGEDRVRFIGVDAYASLVESDDVASSVPESVLFPWLHGADEPNTAQAAYFGFKGGQRCKVPRFRGHVTVCADGLSTPLRRRSFVSSASISSTFSNDSSSSSSEASTSSSFISDPESFTGPLCQLRSSFQPEDLLDDRSRFLQPSLTPNVNLRNFRIQPAKYVTVSDVYIYSAGGGDSAACLELSKRFAKAQEEVERQRHQRGETDCLAYNVYIIRETFEEVERLHPELVAFDSLGFSRNRLDFFEREREEMRRLTQATEIAQNVYLGNTQDVPPPRDRTLTNDSSSSLERDTMEDGNPLGLNICVEAHDQAIMSPPEHLRAYELALETSSEDAVHLECLSTGQAFPNANRLVEDVVALAVWLRCRARKGRKVLIHCQDGYTDSSILALAYIMYEKSKRLPEAYVYLQNDLGRSFFVYPGDRELLHRIESKVFGILQLEGRSSKLPAFIERQMKDPWFYDDRFDGHFPSRILPFLYLGNLNHATNALMLKKLGITHVVSIGECAISPPEPLPTSSKLETSSRARLPTNSLWFEYRLGTVKVLDLQGVSDDGIDSIRRSISQSNSFIEEARASGGKVLVHCRVGVSRSATLTIAYLMMHLGIDLASAYLLCRSRRLNILIQPTLLFMHALQWYEAKLDREEQGRIRQGRRLSWPYLSQQVFLLNARYLSC